MPLSSNASVERARRGVLLVISGPSGVGKSSVVREVLRRTGARFSVSVTTRPRRPGERDGIDYRFVDAEEFDRMMRDGELLEWAEYGGHRYGTPKAAVLAHLDEGDSVVLDIENRGARQVKEAYPDAVLVFLAPPSMAELERRLRSRGDTDEEAVARRLGVAARQIAEAPRLFDHVVVNDDLETTIARVVSILESSLPRARGEDVPASRSDPTC